MPLTSRLMRWIPRILGIGAVVYMIQYALAVIGGLNNLPHFAFAFLNNLIPALILALQVGVAWRWPAVGGVLFLFLSVLHPLLYGIIFHWTIYLFVSGGPALIGLLFLADWGYRRRMLTLQKHFETVDRSGKFFSTWSR
jgi:hypothetical protein